MKGDSYAPSTQESTAAQIQAMTQNLPALMQVTNAQFTPNELAQLEAARAVTPGYAKLQADTYDTEGRRLNEIGNEIARINQIASAQNDLATMQTAGLDLVKEQDKLARSLDPEYYNVREGLGGRLKELLASGAS